MNILKKKKSILYDFSLIYWVGEAWMISHFDLNFLFINFSEIQFSGTCQFCSSQADHNMGSHIPCLLTTKHRNFDYPEKA